MEIDKIATFHSPSPAAAPSAGLDVQFLADGDNITVTGARKEDSKGTRVTNTASRSSKAPTASATMP